MNLLEFHLSHEIKRNEDAEIGNGMSILDVYSGLCRRNKNKF